MFYVLVYILVSYVRFGAGTQVHAATPPVGPKQIAPLRRRPNGVPTLQFKVAQEFANLYGRALGETLRERIGTGGTVGSVAVVVALGGAEHLGTLLELYLSRFAPGMRVPFFYTDLSREVMRPWQATYRKRRRLYTRVGIGPLPPSYVLNDQHSGVDFDLETSELAWRTLAKRLAAEGVFGFKRLIVIDTGFLGTTVQAVGYLARQSDSKIQTEGILLSHKRKRVIDWEEAELSSEFPVYEPHFSIPKHAQKEASGQRRYWAMVVDSNSPEGFGGNGGPIVFPRSSKLNLDCTEDLLSYRLTLTGLASGLAADPK